MNSSCHHPCKRFPGGKRLPLLLVCGALLGLTACDVGSGGPPPPDVAPTATIQDPADIKYYPSDEPVRLGLEYFSRGNYGLSQRYFRDAVEKSPRDATAWVGLAASYDRVRRFDLADQAYAAATKLTGETVQILNNEGYSYMLRGDLAKARAKFSRAYELDPENPTIVNNLELLNASNNFVLRPPE